MNNMNPTIEQNLNSELNQPLVESGADVVPFIEGESSEIISVKEESVVTPIKMVPVPEEISLIGTGYLLRELGEIGQFTGKGISGSSYENLSDTARAALRSKIEGEIPSVD